MNALSSSHFVIRTIPVPSQKIILSRSFRFDLKTKTLPQYGSAPNACATIATKPWTPRRKSIGRDATNTFKSPRRPITTRDAARPTQPKASWRQRPREHQRARQPSQSQSSVGAMPIQARLHYRPSHSSWQSLRTSLRGRTVAPSSLPLPEPALLRVFANNVAARR